MSSHFSSYDEDLIEDPVDEESNNDYYILRDSIIFLVDGTKQMYENDSFKKCLETYKNIVREKCCNNRKDKMGFIIFGTKETNCNVDNVMTLQEFDKVTIDTLKSIKNILNDGDDKYRKLASDSKYPLYNAFEYAFQVLNSTKSSEKTRNIVLLCTCNDNPCPNALSERRRIEYLIATFKDLKIQLHVAGLSDSWNDTIYYKDLQIISGTFNNETYRRFPLEEFEKTTLYPARTVCTLPWKINDISIEVSIVNLISTPKYPSKTKLEKDGNEVLESRNFLRQENLEDNTNDMLTTDRKFTLGDSILYYKTYSGVDVCFTALECKQIKNLRLEPIIEVLAFKPIVCDPLYHCASPYFITYNKSCSDESKTFFITFISKCAEKQVMPICNVVTKTTILISLMIPSVDDGGFFMYKIPFNDNVRDLDGMLQNYIFDSGNRPPVINNAVKAFGEMMECCKIQFNPRLFTNPKLEKYITHIEALALEEPLQSAPPDRTIPPRRQRDVAELVSTLIGVLDLAGESAQKRPNSKIVRAAKKRRLDIIDLAQRKELNTLTVTELKDFLKEVGEPCNGTKSNLIDRVNNHFSL